MHRRVRHLNPAQCGAQVALDARFITGVANGAALSSWPSRSVASISATQGAGAQQPTFRASSINGRPAVEFDGSADNMDLSASALSLTNNVSSASITTVAVSDSTSADSTQYITILSISGTATPRASVASTSTNSARSQGRRLDADSTVTNNNASSTNVPFIGTARANFADNSISVGVNGVFSSPGTYSSGAGNSSATNSFIAKIGAQASTGSRFGGRIAAVVVAVPMLPDAVAKRVRQHLGFSFRIATT